MCDTPSTGGRTAGPASAAASAAPASNAAPSIRLGQAAEHVLDVADRLREAGQGVVLVLLVLEAEEVGILHVEERAQDRRMVDHAAAALDGLGVRGRALDVLHVQVVETLAALADRLRRVHLGA